MIRFKNYSAVTQVVAILLGLVLIGCATVQFEGSEQALNVTPAEVIDEDGRLEGQVIWGGRIVGVYNQDTSTQLEVLAYPMSSGNRPQIDRDPIGRFLVLYPDFLEPETYAPGRYISLFGTLDGLTEGEVGRYDYEYPVVQSQQIHLWSKDPRSWQPIFSFGIGVHL